MITIPGLSKKPKDFNKPADKNEFQLPVNGEYKANPTFFAARSDDERCQAIDLWLSSIRYEASQSSYGRRYQRGSDEIDMQRIDIRQIQRFATTFFRNIFGKSLSEFSENEVEKVAKSLDKCSHQRWVSSKLESGFRFPAQMRDWIANFDEIEQSNSKEKLAVQKQLYRERYQKEARERGFNVAELLKETELFNLHAAFLNDGNTDWCLPSERQAVVGLIFNIDEVSPIENDEEYWESFESEMLPAIRSHCREAEKIYVLNYVDGVYINYNQNQVNSKVNPSFRSDVVNIGVYSANQNGASRYGWINGDTMANLMDSNSFRTQRTITFNNSQTQLGNTNLATISGVRNFLTARKAKFDEEARLRAEKEAAAEAARLAEIARKAEARRALLAKGDFLSKGLKNEEIFANIFLGDFEALPFKRDDISFTSLFGAYLNSYAEQCPKPNPGVEMTRRRCILERVTTTSRTCIEWVTEGTGLFADPTLYEAKLTAERAQVSKVVNPKNGGGLVGGLTKTLEDFMNGKTLSDMEKALDVSTDVAPLIKMNSANACSSSGLKRFQENLRRFALNERPLLDSFPSKQPEVSLPKPESEKPKTIVQKPKPTTKKPPVNSRRKN